MSEVPPTIVAARYMTRFRCLGADCEDNCCGGWQINVDRPHFVALERVLGASRQGNAELRRALEVLPRARRSRAQHAVMRLGPEGMCTFLGADKLCRLHAQYGDEVLPDTCAVYPRHASRVGAVIELVSALSCPETARLCLLAPDALEFAPLAPELAGRPHLRQDLAREPKTPYARRFVAVREVVLDLLRLRDFPVAVRLFFVAYVARRLGECLRPSMGTVDERLVDAELDAIRDPEAQRELARVFQGYHVERSSAADVVLEILRARAETTRAPRFEELVRRVFASYAPPVLAGGGGARVVDVDRRYVATTYERRKSALPPSLGARLDQMLENYARCYWLREWYLRSPSVLAHTQSLLARIAVVRFLILSQLPTILAEGLSSGPTESGAAAVGSDEASPEARFDARAIEVFYSVSRVIEHDPTLLAAIGQALIDHQMLALGESVALLRW